MAHVIIDMTSSQQQHSSDLMQNNNGDNRSLALTSVGAQEKFVPITALLEMGANRLGVLVCGWVVFMLVQGGIIVTVETKDRGFITVLFFFVCFRCWRYFYPQDTRSLTEGTQSLSADNIQQLVLPIGFIRRLFYWWNLVSVMTCVVLSIMRLASQDFGQTEVANKGARDFALNVFYGLALTEALVLLFTLTFVTIMAMQRKVTEALFEWAKPSQPAQAPPTHQNTTLFEWAKSQLYANSVDFSPLPESEVNANSVDFSPLPESEVYANSVDFSPLPESEVYANSVDFSPLPESEVYANSVDFSPLPESEVYANSVDFYALPKSTLYEYIVGFSLLPESEHFANSVFSYLRERLPTRTFALQERCLQELRASYIFGRHLEVPRLLDWPRTISFRNLKYIHPSLEYRGLHRRLSRHPRLLLNKDYSDNSEDNLPHLKAD